MDSLESPWWGINLEAMEAEAKELGAELVITMAEGDAAKQNQQIESLIGQGVDAIICAPKDGAAIATSIKKAQDAGIPFVVDNRPITGDVLPDVQVVADNEGMAQAVVETFAKNVQDEGKVYKTIVMIGGLADEGAVLRKAGHDAAIANYPDVFDVVAEVPTDWNLDTALSGLQNALQANPDVDLILLPSDYLYPPTKSALEQIERWVPAGEDGHVAIVAFDGDNVGLEMIRDGYSWGDASQDAILEGELCVQWAVKLVNGETPEDSTIYDPGVIITPDNYEEVAPDMWSYSLMEE